MNVSLVDGDFVVEVGAGVDVGWLVVVDWWWLTGRPGGGSGW